MVDDIATDLTYRPLAAAGLTRCSSSRTARKFEMSWSRREADLADGHLNDATATGIGPVLDPAALEV